MSESLDEDHHFWLKLASEIFKIFSTSWLIWWVTWKLLGFSSSSHFGPQSYKHWWIYFGDEDQLEGRDLLHFLQSCTCSKIFILFTKRKEQWNTKWSGTPYEVRKMDGRRSREVGNPQPFWKILKFSLNNRKATK